jgi:putative spermidine/putrescine transport system ATP-binding protein
MKMETRMHDPYVKFEGVQKTYDGEVLVVKNLNLDIAKGEFLTLLGPSGSGKTSTLMMLAGFESATEGEIYLDGKPINRLAPEHRNIGMVFQNYALFPHMTVAENLAFPLKVRKYSTTDIDTRVKATLDMVGLGGFGNRHPGQMSGGQAQRVAVARALVFEPKLVLMDEPLSALDKQLREQMQYEIKQIHNSLGVTIVYVTHDQGEALTMSDRIAVFNNGEIQQLDTPNALYEAPNSAFVASFIGENNRLVGTITQSDKRQTQVKLHDGTTLAALPIKDFSNGQKTMLSIRPERICIRPEPGKFANTVSATVRELIYLGDHIRVRAQACGSKDFVVKVPNASNNREVSIGDSITIGWHIEDCRALDCPKELLN